MDDIIQENGVLMGYFGHDRVVIVPDGIKAIGGLIKDNQEEKCPMELRNNGSLGIAYNAFYNNKDVEIIYFPDSVVSLGFKSLEHCTNLRIISFSYNLKSFGTNCLTGCDHLKTIVYRGTVFEFSRLDLGGNVPDLEIVICNDGIIYFKNQKYIDTLHFPGIKGDWEKNYADDWLAKKCRRVIFSDGEVLEFAKH